MLAICGCVVGEMVPIDTLYSKLKEHAAVVGSSRDLRSVLKKWTGNRCTYGHMSDSCQVSNLKDL